MITPALALFPTVVAVVLLSAGAAKLGRPRDVLMSLQNFGAPPALVNRTVAVILPVGEILLGAALLTTHGWLFALSAVAATALMTLFTLVVARAVFRRETFECGCFGAAHSPVSGMLLMRNVLLVSAAAVGLFLGLDGFEGVVPVLARFGLDDASWVATGVFFAGLVASFVATARPSLSAPTQMSQQNPAALAGTDLPDVYLMTNTEEPVRILDMVVDRAQLLVFVRPGCRACATLLADAASVSDELTDGTGMILVVVGDKDTFASEHPELVDHALFGAWSLASYLRISAFPAAALIGAGGVLQTEPVAGIAAIHNLASRGASLHG